MFMSWTYNNFYINKVKTKKRMEHKAQFFETNKQSGLNFFLFLIHSSSHLSNWFVIFARIHDCLNKGFGRLHFFILLKPSEAFWNLLWLVLPKHPKTNTSRNIAHSAWRGHSIVVSWTEVTNASRFPTFLI